MNLSGKVNDDGWTVTACAHASGTEFGCLTGTSVAAPDGVVVREFSHDRTVCTPREAVLDSLKLDMSWVGLIASNTICGA
ncbi:hypothetical protein [Paraburkholderia caffeinilytica]|uniref:hypothetical protein n=1 Tax=Paraburkholderia caffeinilytica TaxID=1761016 RepID=UPI0038B9AF48